VAYLVHCPSCRRKRRIDIGEPPYDYDGPAMFECANMECMTVFDALGTAWIVRCPPSHLMTKSAEHGWAWWRQQIEDVSIEMRFDWTKIVGSSFGRIFSL